MNSEYHTAVRYTLGSDFVTIVIRNGDPVMVLCQHVGTKHIIKEDRLVYVLKTLDGQNLERDLTELRPSCLQRDMELFFLEQVKILKKKSAESENKK